MGMVKIWDGLVVLELGFANVAEQYYSLIT